MEREIERVWRYENIHIIKIRKRYQNLYQVNICKGFEGRRVDDLYGFDSAEINHKDNDSIYVTFLHFINQKHENQNEINEEKNRNFLKKVFLKPKKHKKKDRNLS